MALDTLERSAPPIFRQGLSATSKMLLLGLLAVLLMAADHRMHISQPIRSGVALVLSPLQWLSLQPVNAVNALARYFGDLEEAQDAALTFQTRTIGQAQRLQQVEQLSQENAHLRQLLDLRAQVAGPAKAVQVLYDTSDPYTRRVVVDRGLLAGIAQGSAVIDTAGVVGQVTRVYPLVSEVTLLTDRAQSIPVMNARTGSRYVANGDPQTLGGSLDLKFVPAGADMQKGDLLTTSGIDGVYPAGLHVGRIARIDRRVDSSFARVHAEPMATERGRHLLVLLPFKDWPAPPAPEVGKGAKPKGAAPAMPATGGKP
ncbi:rod shape-determining protein MreC [Limnohabitans sp. Bal53]|jgi:rod shape-determining protein MreC|uniref:rod shape-determining protein MreC n=1 Tax=Limnohabitans sp. Bal53 TaxID=1977910 RepID=UPI000D360832|nr:rod shape-determining protein MreC [Limnohabitans sp. Bal53]PUE43079.1 rod shape-determining protein MreC [Limnohabitans sp. Bal53]